MFTRQHDKKEIYKRYKIKKISDMFHLIIKEAISFHHQHEGSFSHPTEVYCTPKCNLIDWFAKINPNLEISLKDIFYRKSSMH